MHAAINWRLRTSIFNFASYRSILNSTLKFVQLLDGRAKVIKQKQKLEGSDCQISLWRDGIHFIGGKKKIVSPRTHDLARYMK